MDYDLQRPTKHCFTTGRELAPGEEFYSALIAEGAELRRADFSIEAWHGPPPGAIGCWKSQIPDRHGARRHWAPNDVLLQCFDELSEQPDKQDMRYVLALLLVRRRVMRLEEEQKDAAGGELLVLYCPRRDTTYEVPVTVPDPTRADAIQQELARLLER
jgi:hypothetical protein